MSLARIRLRTPRLLDDMTEFMSDQMARGNGVMLKHIVGEHDMLTGSIGFCSDRGSGVRGLRISMNSHSAKVVPKTWFDEGARRGVKGLALTR